MVAMARHRDADGTVGTGRIAAEMGRPPANLSSVRGRLDKGLIQTDAGGSRSTCPGWRTWC